MKLKPFVLLFIVAALASYSCERSESPAPAKENAASVTPGPVISEVIPPAADPESAPPRLVVGIVVDQMRYEFLTRYWDKFGEDGFKRLVGDGFSFDNANYNYVPTTTCPGHASVYTGTTPSVHGIIGNDWYARAPVSAEVYCADDPMASLVGGNAGSSAKSGQKSPRNMLTSTVTDELRLASGMKPKVIGIALKDRAAIMPAGHLGTAAYWLDDASGEWVTSSYYYRDGKDAGAPELPGWVKDFNAENSAEKYLARPEIKGEWNTLLDISSYEESMDDDSEYEKSISGKDASGEYRKPVFPYVLKDALTGNPVDTKGMYGRLITATPFGNSITKDFAIAAVEGEGLGGDGVTDFLAVSFSSTDIVGHYYGPRSIEVEDTYLRLDRDISEFLEALDAVVGEGSYLVFLTADHGVVDVPLQLENLGLPAGYFTEDDKVVEMLNAHLAEQYRVNNLVLAYSNQQVYLDRELIRGKVKAGLADVEREAAGYLMTLDGVADAVTASELNGADFTTGPRALVENGYNRKRSGDVAVIMEPNWIEYKEKFGKKGTTHGAPYSYDTHVPLIFYGWKIEKGSSMRPVHTTDAAPTVSALLGIPFPNGATGEPLVELFKQD